MTRRTLDCLSSVLQTSKTARREWSAIHARTGSTASWAYGVALLAVGFVHLTTGVATSANDRSDADQVVADRAGIEFFENKIRPVLIKHCYECHSADSEALKGGLLVDSLPGLLQGGDSGSALVPHKPDESLLLEALKFESFEMPPAGKLPQAVIADFERWIAMGAPDPRTEMLSPRYAVRGVDLAAGRQFWAFQPPEAHVIPEVQQQVWAQTWIDRFILQRLEEADLTPGPTADRTTLIRRLSYDLTGLPPQPEDIEKYAYNNDPGSLQEYVDKLLQSQQFGEQWGRHWLDVARYADSNGGDFNATFHEAWRYRNYVVETFNADRPFSEFIVEQIAGDLLEWSEPWERERNLVATGFLMLGAKMLSERDKEKLRMDVVDDQISAVGEAFLGLTLGCARCHDHKFDPIPTTDYYALAGIFRSTQTLDGEIQKYVSNWTRQPLPLTSEHAAELKQFQETSARLKKEIKAQEAEVKQLEEMSSRGNILSQGIVVDDEQAELVGNWKASTYSKNFIGKGYVHDDQQDRGKKRAIFRATLPQSGEYEVRFAFPGSGGRATNVPVTITHATGTTTVKVDQSKQAPILTMLLPLGRFTFNAEQPAVVEISNTDADGYVIVDAVQFVPVAELEQTNLAEDAQQAKVLKAAEQQLASLQAELKEVEKQAPPPAPVALAVREAKDQGDFFVCIRGEPRNRGPQVPRGFLSVANFDEAPVIESGQSGRLELGKWVADARNPLTARVYVNRVWSRLMGTGIVRTVDNFGQLGERPTHPLLLDQLAVEFIANNWSTKWLVRQIVLSHVYQLASTHDADRYQADPENRLYWRAERKPLPAEAIRDTMLLAATELDLTIGGPPVDNLGTLVSQNRPDDSGVQLQSSNIRTLYQPVIRNELPSLMRVFDFADPDFVSGQRPQTTVPTQALWMLNGPFVAEQSAKVARRLLQREFSTDGERLEHLYLTILGRPPTESESTLSLDFLSTSPATPEESWTDLAHALYASTNFRMLD